MAELNQQLKRARIALGLGQLAGIEQRIKALEALPALQVQRDAVGRLATAAEAIKIFREAVVEGARQLQGLDILQVSGSVPQPL